MSKKKEKISPKMYSKIFGSTFGHIAFASFFIALLSGIFLSIFYDIKEPFDSISMMLIANPSASFIRSLHYWSAQLFMILIILHVWDHLRKSTEMQVKRGVWIRLSISILTVFFVMLTGFILKADADSIQAKRILETLLQDIPLIGSYLSFSLLGKGEDFQLIYVHHIATTTIFVWIIIVEHVKQIWPNVRTLLYSLLPIILLTLFYPSILHSNHEPIIKGPWYFLGVQELFHYMTYPEIILWIFIFLFIMIVLLQKFDDNNRLRIKIFWLVISIIYFVLIIIGYFFRGENWEFVVPWKNNYFINSNLNPINNSANYFTDFNVQNEIPKIMGEREGCLYCHSDMEGFSPSHDPEAVGCASCHQGNTFTIEKSLAHSNLIKIPGNLETANLSCGQSGCHPGIKERVDKSIMNTMNGVISVNRYIFGETNNFDELHYITNIGKSAADTHLRNLCASCHIGNEKFEYGPITELSRGGGCNACHLNYTIDAEKDLQKLSTSHADTSIIKFHPSLDLNISNNHCFGCHSRSGRISTNYEGWHETQLKEEEMPSDSLHRLLEDGRVFTFVEADIHHQRGLECIDCHNSYELMGDGESYAHQEEQSKIMCEDCHFTHSPNYVNNSDLDSESKKIAKIRGFDFPERKYLITKKDSIPLINTFIEEDNTPYLIGKNSKKKFNLNPPNFICIEGKVHDRLTCNSCHTAWAPQCVGCHTEFDPNEIGIDHLTGEETKGSWKEWVGEFIAELPTLGVMVNSLGEEVIETFVPGMIMTLDKSKFNGSEDITIFHRLFAPTVAHTTSTKGRSCKSCHNDPLAIGYGRGELKFSKSGKWEFQNKYVLDEHDQLPEDAWIGFLNDIQGKGTRTGARPFAVEEQKRILTVGACLTCHDESSRVMMETLTDFNKSLDKVSKKCVLPVW
ncbi:MAG: cytochrome b N-terminal domain-containing protein [Bacteroidota bacterium]